MQKYLFKIFYIGKGYRGFQRQPNGQAIENAVELAFIKSGLIDSFSFNRYRGCSRTDAGVNALGNTFTLYCNSQPNLALVNSYFPKDATIIVYAMTSVDPLFNPRNNSIKKYNYFITHSMLDDIYDIERIYYFEGSYNFSRFIKKDGAGEEDPNSTIQKIEIEEINDGILVKLIGNKFGREQIRRMIGFLFESKYSDEIPLQYLTNGFPISLHPAPSQFLTLMEVIYDVKLEWNYSHNLGYLINKIKQRGKKNKDYILFLNKLIKENLEELINRT